MTQQNRHIEFWRDFNKISLDRKMSPTERVERILALDGRYEELPNDQSRWMFKTQANLMLGQAYVQLHQRYKLTPLIEECKVLIEKSVEYEFATQSKVVWGQLGSRFENDYVKLAELCQAKNNQREVAYCYGKCLPIWDKIGDELRYARVLALQNIAFAKIPNQSFFTREQLIEQFPNRATIINETFDKSHCLKTDPIEQSLEYVAIYDQAEQIIQGLIEQQGRLARCPEQYWNIKKEVLQLHFGIHWKSPRQLNPKAVF